MVNKLKRGIHGGVSPPFLRKALLSAIILLIFVFSPHFIVSGQKLTKYYTAATLDSGTLYFIFPLDDFQETTAKSRLIFDISYLSSRDSAMINFSYFYSSAHPAHSLILKSEDNMTVCPARKLFMDVENHQKWHHRFTTTIHLSDLAFFFQSDLPPEIIIVTDDDHLIYRINKRHWKKQGNIISVILQMIQVNS